MNIRLQSFIPAFTLLAYSLFTMTTSIAADHWDTDRAAWELNNHRLVVANMTDDLRSFGLGQTQAEMLAEQTADFGILGMMTTVAAVGINVEREARTAYQQHELRTVPAVQLIPMSAQGECGQQKLNGYPNRRRNTFS